MIAAAASESAAAVGERGQQHAVGDLADDPGAGHGHRAVDAARRDGEAEHAGLLGDRTPDVSESAPDDGVSAGGHTAPSVVLAEARMLRDR